MNIYDPEFIARVQKRFEQRYKSWKKMKPAALLDTRRKEDEK